MYINVIQVKFVQMVGSILFLMSRAKIVMLAATQVSHLSIMRLFIHSLFQINYVNKYILFIKFSGGTIYLKNNASSQILKMEILLGDQFQIKVTENVEFLLKPKICKLLDYLQFFLEFINFSELIFFMYTVQFVQTIKLKKNVEFQVTLDDTNEAIYDFIDKEHYE